jgi:hypothetical protein
MHEYWQGAKIMNLFFYMPRPSEKGAQLLSAAAPFVSRGSLEVFRDLTSFAERVRRPKDPFSAALIFDPTREDLRGITSLRDFLKDTRTLLILPDEHEEMISLAHRIFPAYIAYTDNNIADIVSVLGQLVKTFGNEAAGRGRR